MVTVLKKDIEVFISIDINDHYEIVIEYSLVAHSPGRPRRFKHPTSAAARSIMTDLTQL